MTTRNTVFSRLFGKQFKSELSASDDIQSAIDGLNATDLDSGLTELKNNESELKSIVSQARDVSNAFISNFDSLEDKLQSYIDNRDKLEQALGSFEGMASDLGIDADQSDAYRDGREKFIEAEDNAAAVVSLQNELYDLYELANELNN
jgi:uncharacterized phage infection (PIP) family protein YhgE